MYVMSMCHAKVSTDHIPVPLRLTLSGLPAETADKHLAGLLIVVVLPPAMSERHASVPGPETFTCSGVYYRRNGQCINVIVKTK